MTLIDHGTEQQLQRLAATRSSQSLTRYLKHVQIDARPEPQAWRALMEPWQGDLVTPMIPALEHAAGLRREYAGPGMFLFVLPRGHDKTGLIGRLANWCLAFAARPLSIAVAASTKDQARLLAKSMDAEIKLNPFLADRIYSYKNELHGPGGTLDVLSSEYGTSSGRKDDVVIIDEWTYWQDRDLFDVLISGTAKRPGSVFVIITNAGIRGTWQHEELIKAQADPEWHVYQSPPGKQLASWMTPAAIDRIRRIIRPAFARRVIGNEWIDATETPLLDESLIRSCIQAKLLFKSGLPRGHRGEFFIGGDFGRTTDRTALVLLERVGSDLLVRQIVVLANMRFADQERVLRELIAEYKPKAVYLDKGAQGYTTVENLEADYKTCQGFFLNDTFQAELGLAVESRFQTGTIQIPDDPDLIGDLQLVEEVTTANGKPKLSTRRDSALGHADRFWALALAVHAADSLPKVSTFVPKAFPA